MHIENRKKENLVLFVCLMLVCGSFLFPDYPTTITTPNGSVVPDTYIRTEMSSADIAYWNSYVESAYPNADRVSSATNTYNCHAYAWHGTGVWIGYSTSTAEDIYWTDGSYVETSASLATKVSYSGNHSAVTTCTSGYYISKWGSLPLMYHYKTDCPAGYGSPSKFYRLAPAPSVDLYVSGDPVYPHTVAPGGTFTALCLVEGYSSVSSTLKYYLSSNSTLDASDTYLGSDSVGSVSPECSSTETENFVLPTWVSDGTWYIIFEVDANNQVAEANENNNTDYFSFPVVTPPSDPDLYINSTSHTPSLVQEGDLVFVKCTVKNQGGTTAGSSTLKYYLSSDSTLSGDDTYLTSRTISSLAPGAVSTEQSYRYSVPTNSPDRIYFIMVADANSQVSEEDENNNTGVRSIFIAQ
jgi:CARDB